MNENGKHKTQEGEHVQSNADERGPMMKVVGCLHKWIERTQSVKYVIGKLLEDNFMIDFKRTC